MAVVALATHTVSVVHWLPAACTLAYADGAHHVAQLVNSNLEHEIEEVSSSGREGGRGETADYLHQSPG